MMESPDLGERDVLSAFSLVCHSWIGRILVEREMRPRSVHQRIELTVDYSTEQIGRNRRGRTRSAGPLDHLCYGFRKLPIALEHLD